MDSQVNCVDMIASRFLGSSVSIELAPKSRCSNVIGMSSMSSTRKRRI